MSEWHCPIESNECTIRQRCTNKCGRKDMVSMPALSVEEVEILKAYRGHFTASDLPPHIRVIDRLLGAKP